MNLSSPRVQLIGWYPGCKLKVGSILTLKDGYYICNNISISENDVDMSGSIFLKLDWYELREEHEMPLYLRSEDGVFKVLHHFKGLNKEKAKCYNGSYETTESYWYMSPATYEEYKNERVQHI